MLDFEDYSPEADDVIADLQAPPPRATTFIGRFRRAIRDPIAEYLDEKATDTIFHETRSGPPSAPPPPDYNEVSPSRITVENNSQGPPAMSPVQRDPPQSTASVSSVSRVVPPHSRVSSFDVHVDPDFPLEAPRARGLVGIPDGWNEGRQIDWEFKAGVRWNSHPSGEVSGRNWDMGMRGRTTAPGGTVFGQQLSQQQFGQFGSQPFGQQSSFGQPTQQQQFGSQSFGQQPMVLQQQPMMLQQQQQFGSMGLQAASSLAQSGSFAPFAG